MYTERHMQHSALDYSALNQPVTRDDIRAFAAEHKKPRNITTYAAIGIGVLFGFILLMNVVSSVVFGGGDWKHASASFFYAAFIALAVFIAVFYGRSRRLKTIKLYKFARANGVTITVNRADPPYTGMIFGQGHSRVIQEALTFSNGIEMGNYTYTTGSGKSSTVHTWGYVHIQLTRRLPHMVLDARKNNFIGKMSNLPSGIARDQQLRLEGNFNDYFTLYAPKEYERDALYVFTPDVMAALIDYGANYDVEIIDDSLMLYATTYLPMHTEESLRKMLAIAEKLSTEIRDQSANYADVNVAGGRVANVIAQPGRRLKTRISVVTIIIVILVVAYQLWMIIAPS